MKILLKKCKTCLIEKSLENFYKYKNGSCLPNCIDCIKKKYHSIKNDKKEIFALRSKKYREENPKKARDYQRLWTDNNREKVNFQSRVNAKKHLESGRLKTANKRASKLKRTPKWLTKEQIKLIQEIYKNVPEGHHVDHVIPLQGDFISGLHVPKNLQYLKSKDNIYKHNKIDLDKFNKENSPNYIRKINKMLRGCRK